MQISYIQYRRHINIVINKGRGGTVKKRQGAGVRERVVDRLNLPKDLLLGAVNVSLTGQYEAYIENYSSIIEYTDCVIKVRGKGLSLKITGKHLTIDTYSKDDMRITGIIKEVIYY